MIVSLAWLKDYTDVHVSPEEFCERMIMSGSNLETMKLVGTDMKDVVVGKIVKITPHPDADKLVVCQVDIGKDAPIQIVTGAPNVFEGAYVPVALDGSRIPGPIHGQPKQEGGTLITKGSLRGVRTRSCRSIRERASGSSKRNIRSAATLQKRWSSRMPSSTLKSPRTDRTACP